MYEEEYITDEQRKDLQDIFDQFDKDKDGKISGKNQQMQWLVWDKIQLKKKQMK